MKKVQNFYIRSSLFIALSLFGAALTYAIYPVLARIFSLRELGDYIAIVGISNQVLGILLAFSVISVALVKQYGEYEAHQKAGVIQKVLLWLFLTVSAFLLILAPFLQHLLKIQNVTSFFILSLIMLLAVPSNIWVGYLQGYKEQIRVGVFTASTAVLKFGLIIFLAVTYGVNGGLWGLFLGSFLGLFVVYYLPGRKVPKLKNLFRSLADEEKKFLHEYKGYIAQSVFVVAGLVFLQNYDLNRAKILFSPQQAGVYGGISVFSNAIYFVLFLLIWILLPEFTLHNQANNKRVLRTAYLIMAGIAVLVVTGGLALGNTLLPILLGDSFSGQAGVLVAASLYQICLVALALYAFYLLVLKKRRSILLTALVLLSSLLIPLHFTSTSFAMIVSLLTSVIIGVILYVLILAIYKAWGTSAARPL